jgi:arabinofuranosyltransferase
MRKWGLLTFWMGAALLPCAVYLGAELYLLDGRLGLPLDDGWIHLQFARNLAAGEGLAYNPGERVAGSTSPLWTALLSIGFLLRLPALLWAKVLGVACHLLVVAGTWRLSRELGLPPLWSGVAAGLTATTGVLVWSALSGMEIPLFAALSGWGIALHVGERGEKARAPLSLAIFGLAVLARPEGLVLLGLALADRLLAMRRAEGELSLRRPDWRSLLVGLALAAIALVPVLLVYQWIAGSPLPTTFDTKAGYASPGMPRVRYLFEVVGIWAAAQPVATLLAPVGLLALIARLGSDEDRGLLPAAWVVVLPLAYGVLSGKGRGIFGNFGRYFYPLLPVVIVLAVLGVAAMLGEMPARLRWGSGSVGWLGWVGALLLLPGLASLYAGAGKYLQNVRDIESGDVRLARWLQPRLPPAATLAVDDIGALKFLLPNRVLDLAGIVSPRVHHYARRSAAATRSFCPGVLEFVRDRRPDYLAIFPRRHACFSDDEFPPLLKLEVPGNVTLGEGTIVLHATPWTREPLRTPPPG